MLQTKVVNDADLSSLANLPISDFLAHLNTTHTGLTTEAAEGRRRLHDSNNVVTRRHAEAAGLFLARFKNPLVLTLLIASGLSASTGDTVSFFIIATIILLSVALDFVQEYRAQNAVETLRRSVAIKSTVHRDGRTISLPVDQLVPGDIIELLAGDMVPADGRLIKARSLFINQSLLTGESYPAEKNAEVGTNNEEKENLVFAGTSVISGTGTAVIYKTGTDTSLGNLASSLAQKPPATAFEIGIKKFSLVVLRLTVLLVLVVLLINIAYHRPMLESLMFALALAVGITPELLPMILTVALSKSAMALAREKVIVKRLSAIHDLGAMDILCTDKTGTLTEAKIELVRVTDAFGQEDPISKTLVYLNSYFETGMKSPLDDAVLSCNHDITGWQKLDEVPFDFERKRISVLVARNDERRLIVKGAPEEILKLSSRYRVATGKIDLLTPSARQAAFAYLAELGAQGYRTLGIGSRVVAAEHRSAEIADEAELVFDGFAVFLDPPKANAATTLQALNEAGVQVKVLTGDNEMVAKHLFQAIGLELTGALSGEEISSMSPEALLARLSSINLFYRVNPQEKLRILMSLKRKGHVVGFMGDGINDSPSLHAADIGISVDGAADVAKDAADVILLEHDLSVVQRAVIHGRRTVQNVSKYIMMASSSNFGNMFSMAGAAFALPFLPMLPTQVLLNNLLYDTSQIALPFDNVDVESIAKPIAWDVNLVQRFMLIFGPISSVFDFLTFYVLLFFFGANERVFQTGWFIESLATQILVVFAIRTRRWFFKSLPGRAVLAAAICVIASAAILPYLPLGRWLGFTPLPITFFGYVLAVTLGYLLLVEMAKRLFFARVAPQRP